MTIRVWARSNTHLSWRLWCSGIIQASHACVPSSILGGRRNFASVLLACVHMGGRTLKVLSGLISRRQSPSSSCAFIPNRVGDGCVGLVVVVVVVVVGGASASSCYCNWRSLIEVELFRVFSYVSWCDQRLVLWTLIPAIAVRFVQDLVSLVSF